MNGSKRALYIMATGAVVIIAVSVVSYWARYIPSLLYFKTFQLQVDLRPSGFLPQAEEGLRDHMYPSELYASSRFMPELGLLKEVTRYERHERNNLFDYTEAKRAGNIPVVYYMWFNKRSGLVESVWATEIDRGGKTWFTKEDTAYIGPKGWSEKPQASLGRFYDLIGGEFYKKIDNVNTIGFLLYDKVLRRFFRITGKPGVIAVQEGDELSPLFEPIQMCKIEKGESTLALGWFPPRQKGDPNIIDGGRSKKTDKTEYQNPDKWYWTSADVRLGNLNDKIMVLEKSSAMSIVDTNTLTVKNVGYMAQSRYEASPCSSLAYIAQPFVREDGYDGLATAGLARNGMDLWMTVFDANGNQVKYNDSRDYVVIMRNGKEAEPEAKIYYKLMGCSSYVIESLSPPLFGFASFVASPHIEAQAGYRAMFLLPNSVMGQDGIVFAIDPKAGIIFGLLAIAPSILLGILLAWRIRVNARMTGLGASERMWWTVGAIAFGLCAYITYRLTLPKMTLVTCCNCGKLRRPDMEECHKCGAQWHIPEIEPPLWRVVEISKK